MTPARRKAGITRAITAFENRVRDDEMRGAGDPDDFEAIHQAYLKAKAHLVEYILKHTGF